jgi:hypothetical protein
VGIRKNNLWSAKPVDGLPAWGAIYLRGEGAGLSWNKGLKLDHKAGNEWIWETYEPINRTEFKVLIDDKLWEEGPNHVLEPGHTVEYTAKFPR